MRLLILVNGAQEHRPFFARVGAELVRRGHDVQYCLDSHYTDYVYPEAHLPPERTHYFSDYLAEHVTRQTLPPELADLNVWTMAFPDVDRLMFTRFGRKPDGFFDSFLPNLAHFYIELFDRFAFDAVVFENVSNTMSYFAWEIAQRRNARYLGPIPSRLPGRVEVVDFKFARDTRLAKTFAEFQRGKRAIDGELRRQVDDYLGHFDQKLPDYMTQPHPFHMGLLQRYAQRRSFLRFTRSVRYRVGARNDFARSLIADPLFVFPEQFLKEALKHVKRGVLDSRLYVRTPDLEADYFLYPLQFHPESSSSVDGATHLDEWANIIGIARNLPHGVKLYVKDHKHAAGRESLALYNRIARIPNVVLVHPDYDTKKLIRHAGAIVVVTSTLGYEAIILGKPVFVLGHPFYEFHPSCVRIESFEHAFDAFSRFREMRPAREDIEALVAAYFTCTDPGSFDILTQYADENAVEHVCRLIETRGADRESARAHVGTGRESECEP